MIQNNGNGCKKILFSVVKDSRKKMIKLPKKVVKNAKSDKDIQTHLSISEIKSINQTEDCIIKINVIELTEQEFTQYVFEAAGFLKSQN